MTSTASESDGWTCRLFRRGREGCGCVTASPSSPAARARNANASPRQSARGSRSGPPVYDPFVSTVPTVLAYDDLPPGSDIRREYHGELVKITVPAGEPPAAAKRA